MEEGRLDEQQWRRCTWVEVIHEWSKKTQRRTAQHPSDKPPANPLISCPSTTQLTVEAGLGKAAGGAGRQQGARNAAQQRVHTLWAEGPHCKGGKHVGGTAIGDC